MNLLKLIINRKVILDLIDESINLRMSYVTRDQQLRIKSLLDKLGYLK